jgi:hypothetical protein
MPVVVVVLDVIHEEEVEHGEAATPPPCLVVDGVQLPWSTNDKAWWNVDSDMVIYPYSYVPNNVVDASLMFNNCTALTTIPSSFYISNSVINIFVCNKI